MGDIQVQEDQDPPEVGQWWVNEHGKRMHIAGKTADGTFVLEFPSGRFYRDHGNWMKCRQLEGCDSWDWSEFPDSPGDGYRFIDKKADEKNVADEFWSSTQQKWVRVHNPLSTWDKTSVYRRKVEPPATVQSPDDWLRYDKHSRNWIPVYAPATIPVRLWVSERITTNPATGQSGVATNLHPVPALGLRSSLRRMGSSSRSSPELTANSHRQASRSNRAGFFNAHRTPYASIQTILIPR